jgi:hypothetical protein
LQYEEFYGGEITTLHEKITNDEFWGEEHPKSRFSGKNFPSEGCPGELFDEEISNEEFSFEE